MDDIPNYLFLGALVVVSVVTWVAVFRWRRSIRGGSGVVRELHPYELAYLREGAGLSVKAALGSLHVGGVLGSVPRDTPGPVHPMDQHYMRVTGSPRHALTPLDEAVLTAAREHSRAYGFRFGQVASDARVREALGLMRRGLEHDGLALAAARRRRLRLAALPLAAPVAVCGIWLAVITRREPPDERAGWAMACALVAGTVLLVAVVAGLLGSASTTLAGARAVAAGSRGGASSGRSGPDEAALAIALGAQHVSGIERPFAHAARIIRGPSHD
ncbi:MAG TPA: TIGR04222 domain-containing membrane protein [Thermomonospora sp.]|nr:TIGR04222 domain-containing membrane protein [Thermomonospora sp.]